MHQPGMVNGDTTSMQFQGHGVSACAAVLDRPDEDSILVVAERGAPVRAGHDHQAAVLEQHVIEGDADSQDIVVGVRVEGPVLVPAHRAAELRRLQVELGPLEPDPGERQAVRTYRDPQNPV